MTPPVSEPPSATQEKDDDNSGSTECETVASPAPTSPGDAAAKGTKGGMDSVAAAAEAALEAKPGPNASSCSKGDPTNSAADKSGEQKTAKELLPNGIPKVGFEIQRPAAAAPSGGSTGSNVFEVHLDAADSHLDLQIDKDNPVKASSMHTGGFQYMWKGVRSTHGVKGKGKYYFEVKVGPKPAQVVMPDTPASTQHVCRVGVSQPLTSLHLGDSLESWGFGGTGKKSTNKKFLDYGGSFGDADVIGVVVDLDALTLAYTKNGQFLGTAFELPQRVRETGLFPHVYVKNFDFQVNFKEKTKWFAPPGEGIHFIGDAKEQDLMANPVEHPKSVADCEFIMMCGLPACGKTYWAEKHMEKHSTKSYVLLGTNAVIDQMKVMGLKRQANYATRWEELMSTATEVFNSLVAYAGSGAVPRNVIIDQTNVFKRARCRKVQPFLAWGTRRCVVMVTDERTLQERTQKREREEGKMVPVAAVMDMKDLFMQAAFALPSRDDGFNVIDYVEMPEAESRREIRRINDEGRAFKANNPGLNNRQPKPHIEARAGYGEADVHPAKRQKGDQWQGDMRQSWASGGPQGGQSDWNGQGQHQPWASGGPQSGWQQHQGAWNGNRGGGNYSPQGNYPPQGGGSGGTYGYGGQRSGQQWSNTNNERQPYGQEQQLYGSGYNGQQGNGTGGGQGYGRSQHEGYDSRYQYGGGGQQWQQPYGDRQGQYAGNAGQWQGQGSYSNSRGGGSYSGSYYPPQGRY